MVDGGREGEEYLSFSPQSPLPFSLFPLSHVSTSDTQTKQCLALLRFLQRPTALHSSRKKSVIIIYTQAQNIILKLLHRAVGSPMSPHCGGLVSIYVEGSDFLGEVFSFEPFLYGSLSSRSLHASGYCHENKTHFHQKGLTLFNNLEIFWISKRPYSLLEKWHLICTEEKRREESWMRGQQTCPLYNTLTCEQ